MMQSWSSISAAPCSAMRLLISTSSSASFWASFSSAARMSLADPWVEPATRIKRSTAQARLTAVGRAAFRMAAAACRSVSRSGAAAALDSYPASASPKAAVAPMAGAPRTTISVMACATALWLRYETTSNFPGRMRWSISLSSSFSQNTVRMRFSPVENFLAYRNKMRLRFRGQAVDCSKHLSAPENFRDMLHALEVDQCFVQVYADGQAAVLAQQ